MTTAISRLKVILLTKTATPISHSAKLENYPTNFGSLSGEKKDNNSRIGFTHKNDRQIEDYLSLSLSLDRLSV
jgi:hypothetical protein